MKKWIVSLSLLAVVAMSQAASHDEPASVPGQTYAAASGSADTAATLEFGGVASIAVGLNHACALTLGGAVKCWGDNSRGQLGNNSTVNSLTPTSVAGLSSGVKSIAAGLRHTCAVMVAGGIRCWGDNSGAQLGDGSSIQRLAPVSVLGLPSGVAAIGLGVEHTCALTDDGAVLCWGLNGLQQVGTGNLWQYKPEVAAGFTAGVKAIAIGTLHSCVLTNGGAVKCWGANEWGQLAGSEELPYSAEALEVRGLPANIVAIDANFGRTCTLTSDSRVHCWGDSDYSDESHLPSPLNFFAREMRFGVPLAAVSNGGLHLCGLSKAGGLHCLGTNAKGQLGNGGTIRSMDPVDAVGLGSGVAAVEAGGDQTCALTVGGTVRCWGGRDFGLMGNSVATYQSTSSEVLRLDGVASLTAGGMHTCATTTASGLKCWGDDSRGELGDGFNNSTSYATAMLTRAEPVDVVGLGSGVAAASAGLAHTCALTTAGGVKCWGSGIDHRLGNGSFYDRLTAADVSGLASGVAAVAAGGIHTCVRMVAGGIKCWGSDALGQTGTGGDGQDVKTPADVIGFPGPATALAAGFGHTCAVTAQGAAYCWGNNYYGQIGIGNHTNTVQRTPAAVTGLGSGVADLAAGDRHTCALTVAGGVKCWGSNHRGQLGDGTGMGSDVPVDVAGLGSGVAAISVGAAHSCALTTAGGVKCWGNNQMGELGGGAPPVQLSPVDVAGLGSGVVAIAVGYRHACALTTAGTVRCWGDRYYGQAGDGIDGLQRVPGPVLSVPVCALNASATSVSPGTTVTVAASCTPSPAAYAWGSAALGADADGGTVTPFFTTTYSVQASNAIGQGDRASVTVTVTGSAILPGKRADYSITKTAAGFTITDTVGNGGTQTFADLKRLRFADTSIAFDLDGIAGMAYRLYQAAFNRAPDLPGLGFQMSAMEVSGRSLREVAQNFIDSPEFANTYGGLDDRQFITLLYANVLRRTPEAEGLAFYLDGLASKAFTRSMILAGFSESPENKALVLPAIKDGIAYDPLYDAAGNGN